MSYYLPAGRWTNFLTHEVIEGGHWLQERHDFFSLPLMVRPNSIIALGNHDARPDYDYSDSVTLYLYELSDGKRLTTVIPSMTGQAEATFETQRSGTTLTIQRQGQAKSWQLLLVNIQAISSVEGGTLEHKPQGVFIKATSDKVTISLSSSEV